jgi:hypothetical protein
MGSGGGNRGALEEVGVLRGKLPSAKSGGKKNVRAVAVSVQPLAVLAVNPEFAIRAVLQFSRWDKFRLLTEHK